MYIILIVTEKIHCKEYNKDNGLVLEKNIYPVEIQLIQQTQKLQSQWLCNVVVSKAPHHIDPRQLSHFHSY